MARDKGLLSDLQIRHWIKAATPLAKADGNGLTFTLSAAGVAGWILRYRHGGRRRELTIGRYPDIGLADARGLAMIKRAEIMQGRNPAADKQKAKATAAKDWSVRELVKDYRAKKLVRLAESTQTSYGRHLKRVEKKLGALTVRDSDEIMLITVGGQMVRIPVQGIREAGRNTQGVKLVNLAEKDKLQAIAPVVGEDKEDAAAEEK